MRNVTRTPAGFWLRALAFGYDYAAVAVYLLVLVGIGAASSRLAPAIPHAFFGNPVAGQVSGFLVITLPVTLYFALSEFSPRRATWGKGRVKLTVTDLQGGRMSRARSLGRPALKFVPWELAHGIIWHISFAADPSSPAYAVAFTLVWLLVGANVVSLVASPARRTLYDRMGGTLVVRSS